MRETLATVGYEPFASITTTRRKYKKDKFIIDIDVLDFGYSLTEIELMVSDESEMPKAAAEIIAFASEHRLRLGYVRGKVIESIRRKNPKHLQVLVSAGVVPREEVL